MRIEIELPPELDWVRDTLAEAMRESIEWTDRKTIARDNGRKLTMAAAPEPAEAVLGRIAATRDLILSLEGAYEALLEERQRALDTVVNQQPEA